VAEPFVLAWSAMPGDFSEQVSAAQLRALVIVQGSDGIAVSELARAMDALPSSATRLCDRLVAAGLIERTPDPTNRRFHTLSLTPAGRHLLERLERFRARSLDAVLTRMPEADRRHLQLGLASFAEAAAPV
jgi:DNA-binding MarR family transcriptional regulator